MEVTKEAIEDLLNILVKPMFDGIVEIEVENLSLFDDPNLTQLYPTVNVTFEKKIDFMDEYVELENKVVREFQSALKYFNIHNSIIDIYVMSD
jgi:hypothetical protein